MAGNNPPMHDGDPQCGWYRSRLIKGGPPVPVAIWMHQPVDDDGELTDQEALKCTVLGKERDPFELWTWVCGDPISKNEYHFILDSIHWAKKNEPHTPEANPHLTVNWATLAPHTFTKEQDDE